MKDRTLKQCDAILTGKSFDEEMNTADKYFATLIMPKSFTGRDNIELSYDKSFEKNCILLTSLANQPVKDLSTKEYFALIQHYNESIKNGRKSDQQRGYN